MALSAEGVRFGYSHSAAVLRGVSLALEPGSVCAIVGPNAAGKTTLLRVLLGLVRPWSGSVTLDGRPLGSLGARARAARLAYVPQRGSVAFAYSVSEVVGFGAFASGGRVESEAVRRVLEAVELGDRAAEPVGLLSAGQQQRVWLARALVQVGVAGAGDTRALLADEPVSAQDPRHALAVMALLRGQAASGLAVAVVLHDLWMALRFCDRAVLLAERGRIVAAGPTRETLTEAALGGVFGVRFREVGAGEMLTPVADAEAEAAAGR